MDILDLDKLMEAANIANNISADMVDETGYNVLTKRGSGTLTESSSDEFNNIIRNGRDVRGDVDFGLDQLDADIAALSESTSTPVDKPIIKNIAATGQEIDNAVKFQEAKPVPQKTFVKTAEDAKKAGAFALAKKAKMDKQNEADLIKTNDNKNGKLLESIDSFMAFIDREKAGNNNPKLIESVALAFHAIKKRIK